MHDGLGGILTGVKLNLQEMNMDVSPNYHGMMHFHKAMAMLDDSMHELRRVAHHLMPESLNRYGLK
ncbi:MAG: histidine kinase, partial [Tannerella sp.]|nr:histidine kinase [Tannerella sp.]